MSSEAIWFLGCTFFAIVIEALFSLFEMACVSFHKVRLQYYVALGKKRAIWLNFLLQRPSRLFGTALIGSNAALQIGSECSRRFYESIHLDPSWAPLTQIFLVVIFAELAPLFAARRHPEQLGMFFAPFMIFISRLLTPIILAFDALSRLIHQLMGKPKETPLFLSREEVKMAFAEKEKDEFNETVGRIFQLKSLTAGQLMTPLTEVHAIASHATVADLRSLLSIHYTPFIPVYHRAPTNIVGIATLRDLLRFKENRRVIEHAHSPWFITEDTSVLQILEQFRRNNQSVAVTLNRSGHASGLLSLDQILSEIFGEETDKIPVVEEPSLHIERTLSGEMSIADFNHEFHADFAHEGGETLNDLLLRELESPPVKGQTVRLGSFLFTVIEPTLTGAKILSVHSLQD